MVFRLAQGGEELRIAVGGQHDRGLWRDGKDAHLSRRQGETVEHTVGIRMAGCRQVLEDRLFHEERADEGAAFIVFQQFRHAFALQQGRFVPGGTGGCQEAVYFFPLEKFFSPTRHWQSPISATACRCRL